MNYYVFLSAIFFIFIFGAVFAPTSHCMRPDISRTIAPTLDVASDGLAVSALADGSLVVPVGTLITFKNFGEVVYLCENGASRTALNYVDLFDKTTGKIVANNVSSEGTSLGLRGPSETQYKMCAKSDANGNFICYEEGGIFYPPKNECDGLFKVGTGDVDFIDYSFSPEMAGEHELSLRLGLISPYTNDPYDPLIMTKAFLTKKFIVGEPGLLVFSQQEVKKIGFYESSGEANQEVIFTLMNKSPFKLKISDYSIACSPDVSCSVERSSGVLLYKDFSLLPNESMVIPGNISFDKSKLPFSFSAWLNVGYTAEGFDICDRANNTSACSTKSSLMSFEAGLLDQQNFQIGIFNESEQKFCVDADGSVGRTGEAYVPRVNLDFTASVPIDACSEKNYLTGGDNQNWVYCSQKEFFLSLAKRIGVAASNFEKISAAEYDKNAELEAALRSENSRLLNFNANLIVQDLDSAQINSTLNSITPTIFVSAGFPNTGIFGSSVWERFANLVKSIKFSQEVGGVTVTNTNLSPGRYRVRISMDSVYFAVLDGEPVFSGDNKLNPNIELSVALENTAPPDFDWFFYQIPDPPVFFSTIADSSSTTNVTNVVRRGEVMSFKNEGSGVSGNFYPSSAVPIAVKISDLLHNGFADAGFTVAGAGNSESGAFTYWTGFASSEDNGCGTISLNPSSGEKSLPYRVPDETVNILGKTIFQIPDLTQVVRDSNMYLETVLYLPVSSELLLTVPFGIYSSSTVCNPAVDKTCSLQITSNDSLASASIISNSRFRVKSVQEIFDKIKSEQICVIKDSSLGYSMWKLFWNQDLVIGALDDFKKSIRDAKICVDRERLSS